MSDRTKVIKNKIPQMKEAVRRQASKLIDEIAANVLAASQRLVPVKSGKLKASGRIENYAGERSGKGGAAKAVVYDAEHAAFVELGTRKTPPQPFLAPAYEEMRGGLENRFGELTDEINREFGK